MKFLAPDKTKIKITGILIVILILSTISSNAVTDIINKSSISKFERASKLDLEKAAKPIIDTLNKQTFDGMQYSAIYQRALYTKVAAYVIAAILFSYLGSCIICTFYIKTKTS